jgi:TPR repeat protein
VGIQDKEELWQQAYTVFESGDENRAIVLFTELAEGGDWRGSHMLGYIFQERGRQNQNNGRPHKPDYLTSARWFRQALSQGEQPKTHYALARHYYYGLGGKFDYMQAFMHLKKSPMEHEPIAKMMLAELLGLGLGTQKDVPLADELFSSVANAGYPAGFIGLARIAIAERKFFKAFISTCRSLYMAAKLVITDKNHPKLVGIGGKYGQYRRYPSKNPQWEQGRAKVTELFPPHQD